MGSKSGRGGVAMKVNAMMEGGDVQFSSGSKL